MNELLPYLDPKISGFILGEQKTSDKIPSFWVEKEHINSLMSFFKNEINKPYNMLYDLTAIDERNKNLGHGQYKNLFTVVYHLLSLERNQDLRLKVPLYELYPSLPSITNVFANANWYEREVYDMFGIKFLDHPNLIRILMPDFWQGHPLRKEHPARATEMPEFILPKNDDDYSHKFKTSNNASMYLNLGPQHPGTHGILRVFLELNGEEIVNADLEIGYHHRGAEKMGERQSFHSYIPYTDRIDYLGGVMNNLPYLLAIEQLANIETPKRAQIIRVMLCELFRLSSHLVWFGTFAQDVGSLSPVFYAFADRERIFDIVSFITGGRMHPSWFRIGGVADDLPKDWQIPIKNLVKKLPKRIKELNDLVMKNIIFKKRTIGVGAYNKEEALNNGVTGPALRACGVDFDFRKKRPYSSYEDFDFDIPIASNGDCYDRAVVRIEEMYQSIRIIEQCIDIMPEGEYKSDHPLATPPRKDKTLMHIETLIHHFLSTSMGPVIPQGESFFGVEASKGSNGYYVLSDGGIQSYRTRIRTPSFAHMQMLPKLAKGGSISDLMAILGSIDYVLADLDR